MISRCLTVLACLFSLLAPDCALAQGEAKSARESNAAGVTNDKKITREEFIARTGVTPEKAKKIMDKYDQGSKGYLHPQEFDAWKAEENFNEPE